VGRHPVRLPRDRAEQIHPATDTSDDLIVELDRLAALRGYPAVLRCDNGPQFACAAVADRAGEHTGLRFIPPGQPWRNG
jgi:putative transposase